MRNLDFAFDFLFLGFVTFLRDRSRLWWRGAERWLTPAESWQLGGKFDPGNREKRSAGLLGLVYIRIGSDLLCLREDGESVFFFLSSRLCTDG